MKDVARLLRDSGPVINASSATLCLARGSDETSTSRRRRFCVPSLHLVPSQQAFVCAWKPDLWEKKTVTMREREKETFKKPKNCWRRRWMKFTLGEGNKSYDMWGTRLSNVWARQDNLSRRQTGELPRRNNCRLLTTSRMLYHGSLLTGSRSSQSEFHEYTYSTLITVGVLNFSYWVKNIQVLGRIQNDWLVFKETQNNNKYDMEIICRRFLI